MGERGGSAAGGLLPPPLDELSGEDAAVLAERVVPVEFAAGSCIFEAGAVGDCCYVIDSGVVRIDLDRRELRGGSDIDTETALAYVEPGQLLGELALVDRLPRSANAYAHSDVRARRIDASSLDELAQRRPAVAVASYAALGKAAALKLRETNARLAAAILPDVPDPEVEEMVAGAAAAQRQFQGWPEQAVDQLLQAMAGAVAEHAEELAHANVRETGLGRVESKIVKNTVLSLGTYAYLAGRPASGTVAVFADRGLTELASPVGVVFGLGPVTNPCSTFAFKALICLKSRNALILSPHHAARNVSLRVEELLRAVVVEHGAPADLVQCVRSRTNRKKTLQFMQHPGVALVLATGGASMVKAAYSSGTPAIGVGAGNTPVLICADADLPSTVEKILLSKTFDNGLLCGAEHNLLVEESIADEFAAEAERQGAAVLSHEEAAAFSARIVDPTTNRIRNDIVGKPASLAAELGAVKRRFPIELVIVPTEDVTAENPYAREKLMPVLSLFRVPDAEAGIAAARELLAIEGSGHTACIHTRDDTTIDRFAQAMPASRILVNSPAAQGMIGMTTGLIPTSTLGCGTFGGTSTTDNVTYTHLLNIKRLAHYLPDVAASWAHITANPTTALDALTNQRQPAQEPG